MNNIPANNDGTGKKIAIIDTQWNRDLIDMMRDAAIGKLTELGVADDDITIVTVPGAVELPLAAKTLAISQEYDAIIAFGVVIRGETTHYDFVAGEASRGLGQVALACDVPVMFGVLTTEDRDQAIARAHPDQKNKGAEIADGALVMANMQDTLQQNHSSLNKKIGF